MASECCVPGGRTVTKMFGRGAFNWSKAEEIEVAEDMHEESMEMILMRAFS